MQSFTLFACKNLYLLFVKNNREGYRLFAPSVLLEEAREFFVLPENETSFPLMIFVVDVREDKRRLLGAITHDLVRSMSSGAYSS